MLYCMLTHHIFQYCSDNEDLFGGYDSILGECSFMAKLDDAEQYMRPHDDICTGQSSKNTNLKHTPIKTGANATVEGFTDSLLADCLNDESFQDLPSLQIESHGKVHENSKNCQSLGGGHTSTPLGKNLREVRALDGMNQKEDTRPAPKARRSMANAMKKAMLDNAATSSANAVKVAQQQKKIVVTEEINVAMQTIQSISSETDLGPFFGLPSKVKDLICRLKGIEDLYGKQNGKSHSIEFSVFFFVAIFLLFFTITVVIV